jgi:hypothetical protein
VRLIPDISHVPGFLRRRYGWIFVVTLVWNVGTAALLVTPLGKSHTSALVIMLLVGALAASVVWIAFGAMCERVAKDATTRLGLRCWKCGYKLDGIEKPVCPECGDKFEAVALREQWTRFLAWSVRGE